MENENMNTEQQTESQPEQKLFTQDEVNAIIQKRLAQVKKHEAAAISDDELTARSKALDEREAALNARETRQTCQSYLREHGLSDELLDVFEISSAEEFIQKVENTQKLMGVEPYPTVKDGGGITDTPNEPNLRDAFLNTPAHKPKEFNPYG